MANQSSINPPTIIDPHDPQLKPYERWGTEIAYAEKELEKWYKRAEDTVKRYLDERQAQNADSKWFNLFYANTVILESALYAQIPKPDVRRKFLDYQDDVARVAATIIQRNLQTDLDDPKDTFDCVMKSCVQDRLVPGLGVPWLRLETYTEPKELESSTEPVSDTTVGESSEDEESANTYEAIKNQCVIIDYVYWRDFVWSPCRIWAERRWVARKTYMTREQLCERFGDEKGKRVPLNFKPTPLGTVGNPSTPMNVAIQMAVVYEIWERATKKAYWWCKGFDEMLDERDDPLKLKNFEPCPEPLFANISTSNTCPRPDYYMIQDQYSELDILNNRISLLAQACKVVGVYDRGAEGVQRMLLEGFDNELIPVDNWAMFAEKGGIKGQVDWLPLEQIVAALNQLQVNREAIKQQIYELTGIADIVRGASKASETLGAQEIKAKFAGVRIGKLQGEVAAFASEILRIKAEIMVKHFDPQILLKRANIANTDDMEFAVDAINMLQSEEEFEWRITVTSDQMAQADYQLEKQDRIELLSAVSGYLEKAMGMVQAFPESAPLVVGMLRWAVASFRGARDIEGMLDKAMDAVSKKPPTPPEDPKAAAEKAKAANEQQKMQGEMQLAQQKAADESRARQEELAMKREEAQIDLMKGMQEMRQAMMEFQMKMQQNMEMFEQQKAQDAQSHAQDMSQAEQDAEFRRQEAARAARANGEAND